MIFMKDEYTEGRILLQVRLFRSQHPALRSYRNTALVPPADADTRLRSSLVIGVARRIMQGTILVGHLSIRRCLFGRADVRLGANGAKPKMRSHSRPDFDVLKDVLKSRGCPWISVEVTG